MRGRLRSGGLLGKVLQLVNQRVNALLRALAPCVVFVHEDSGDFAGHFKAFLQRQDGRVEAGNRLFLHLLRVTLHRVCQPRRRFDSDNLRAAFDGVQGLRDANEFFCRVGRIGDGFQQFGNQRGMNFDFGAEKFPHYFFRIVRGGRAVFGQD